MSPINPSTDSRRERAFTCATLTTEGSVSTRMRSGRVNFTTTPGGRFLGMSKVTFSKYGRDDLLAWIAQSLAEGETVILHPDPQTHETTEVLP